MSRHSPSPSLPADAIVVTTYDGLERYVAKFANGELDLVILVGRHGTGKTEGVRRALKIDDAVAREPGPHAGALYVEGHAQPFGLYRGLWQYRDRPIVLDELDKLYADADCIRLLKPLCSGRPAKRVSWLSNTTARGPELPESFGTRSNVMLIANEWKTLNPNVRALEDRAIILHFDPSAAEVHTRVKAWFDDPEVYDFVASLLPWTPAVSMRHYEKGRRLRLAGFADWRTSVMRMMIPSGPVGAVVAAQADPSLTTERQRVASFVRQTGRSRPTYYRIKRQLAEASTRPPGGGRK